MGLDLDYQHETDHEIETGHESEIDNIKDDVTSDTINNDVTVQGLMMSLLMISPCLDDDIMILG